MYRTNAFNSSIRLLLYDSKVLQSVDLILSAVFGFPFHSNNHSDAVENPFENTLIGRNLVNA